jgi:hypothetical protein
MAGPQVGSIVTAIEFTDNYQKIAMDMPKQLVVMVSFSEPFLGMEVDKEKSFLRGVEIYLTTE